MRRAAGRPGHRALPAWPRRVALAARAALPLLAALTLPAAVQAQVRFDALDLSQPATQFFPAVPFYATALNNAGDVVGYTSLPGGHDQALLWRNGRWSDPFGGTPGQALAIDEAGRVYGWVAGPLGTRAWAASRVRGGPGADAIGDFAIGQNMATGVRTGPAGVELVGLMPGAGGASFAALASYGAPPLDLPGSGSTLKSASGVVIGSDGTVRVTGTVADGSTRSFTLTSAGLQPLNGLPGARSVGVSAVNAQGLAVGWSDAGDGFGARAVAFSQGQVLTLGSLRGHAGGALGVNDAAQIVGWSDLVDPLGTTGRAFIAGGPGGALHNLNDLVNGPVNRQFPLDEALAINASGQVLAVDNGGRGRLLTPTGSVAWQASAGGRFGDGAAWDSGIGFAPVAGLDARIAPAASQTVLADADARMRSLAVGSAQGGQVLLRLSQGATLSTQNGFTLAAGSTLTGDGHIAGGAFVNRGSVLAASGQVLWLDSAFTNHGTVGGDGTLRTALNNPADGRLVVGAGQSLLLSGAQHASAGLVDVHGGGQWQVQGQFTNAAGGTLRLDYARLDLADGLLNQGTVQVAAGGASVSGTVANAAGGRIVAAGSAPLTFWNALTNDGEIRAASGAQIVYFGPVNGGGSFTTTGAVSLHDFEGGYSPGHSPAAVTLGNVVFNSPLVLEIGGTAPGSGYDQISFAGTVRFEAGAVIQVRLIDGFQPMAGQVFQLLNFSQAPTGLLPAVQLPVALQGLGWNAQSLLSDGRLAVTAAVPEPQTWALWLAGLLGLGWWVRRPAAPARPGRAAGLRGAAAGAGGLALGLALTGPAQADVTWSSGAGANGHAYRLVSVTNGITWDAAQSAALALGGYLATVPSAAENDVVFALAVGHASAWFVDTAGHARGPWLGGFQAPGSAEPAGGWQWVNGEGAFATAGTTQWAPGQPNDSGGVESRLQFFNSTAAFDRRWNDASPSALALGYVVEWQAAAVPEPRPAASLLAGLSLLLWLARRRRV